MKKSNVTGLALAIGAAAVFAFTPVASVAKSSGRMVHCMGVNACKGKSSCKTANNSCKGKNSCKGQGTVAVSANVCDQIGGTVEGKS